MNAMSAIGLENTSILGNAEVEVEAKRFTLVMYMLNSRPYVTTVTRRRAIDWLTIKER